MHSQLINKAYDIVGDIHGHLDQLQILVEKLGYSLDDYSHPNGRQLVFLGDYLDRGPDPIGVLRLVKKFVDNGSALAIMGNHEYNCLAWFTPLVKGSSKYCRDHDNPSKYKQIKETLDGLDKCSHEEREELLDWLRTLPLALHEPGFLAVHACWHPYFIDLYFNQFDQPLNDEFIRRASQVPANAALTEANALAHPEFWLIETLLKGLEAPLPRGAEFKDAGGTIRHHARINWWNDLTQAPIEQCIRGTKSSFSSDQEFRFRSSIDPFLYIHDQLPSTTIFVGHYWLSPSDLHAEAEAKSRLLSGTDSEISFPLTPQANQIYCLDYSVAAQAGGHLVAYRLDKEVGVSVIRDVI